MTNIYNIKVLRNILVLIFFFSISTFAQNENIAVKSFKILSHDLDAKTYYPRIDQNGDKAALIKVVTTEKGFAWEGDGNGIVASEYKTGEYWIYIPYGSKRLTIKHSKLGVLRNYVYPIPIKAATVYEMVLATGKVVTTVEDYVPETQWLIISGEPEKASVYINNEYVGETPYQAELALGEYDYRIEYPMYNTKAGKITLSEAYGKKYLNSNLSSNYGVIRITSSPESGADVFLDGKNTGMKTPCELTEVSSGEHNIMLKQNWYLPQTEKVVVSVGESKLLNFAMKANYANVVIKTDSLSSVFVDDQFIGKGNQVKRVSNGFHTIRVNKKGHKDVTVKYKAVLGEEKHFDLNPKPIYGRLKIISTPFDAEVVLNGKEYGTTPMNIPNIVIGEYNLQIKKDGFISHKEVINVEEDKTKRVEITLETGTDVIAGEKELDVIPREVVADVMVREEESGDIVGKVGTDAIVIEKGAGVITDAKEIISFNCHKSFIYSTSFSHDGKYISTASRDKTAKIWDAKSGKLLHTLIGHTSIVYSAMFSPDDKYIVTASADETAKIWDVESGKLLHTLIGHASIIYSAMFSPDGKYIVTSSADETAKIWNAKSGKLLDTLRGHNGSVYLALFTPDDRFVITASGDNTAKVWNNRNGKYVFTLKGHVDDVHNISCSPDGRYIVTVSGDKTAKIWDSKSGKLLHTLIGHDDFIKSAMFSPDGKYIVTSSGDKTAKIWESKSGKLLHTLNGNLGSVNTALYSPDGKYIITASGDKNVKIWDSKSGSLILMLRNDGNVHSALFSPNGKYIVTISSGKEEMAQIWKVIY